jgi:uncharacterized membrane protein
MYIELNKSRKERIGQAILFEVVANTIIVFGLTYIIQVPLKDSAMLSVISATAAMAWNYLFNKLFDRLQLRYQFERTLVVRMIHALVFEVGLIAILVPVVMWLLKMNIWQAFAVEMGLILFFLPYTLIFNWSYDYLRWLMVTRRAEEA